jgi:hypothetical protein
MEADQVIVEPQGDACHWPIDLAVAVQNLYVLHIFTHLSHFAEPETRFYVVVLNLPIDFTKSVT